MMACGNDVTDTRAQELTLRKHYDVFEKCGDCNLILGMLRARKLIPALDYQLIMAERTQIERNRYTIINA